MDTAQEHKTGFRCIEGLIHYAVERQLGFEAHQQNGPPSQMNPERRNDRTRELTRGIAEVYHFTDKAAGAFVAAFNDRLRAARTCFATETLPQPRQRETVQGLLLYARRLSEQPGDRRQRLLQISDHFEDMASCLSWDAQANGLYPARDWMDHTLARLTALSNILFTRVLIGPERGPTQSDFAGGRVTDAEGMAETRLFKELSNQYPEIGRWPAICTVYRGGYGTGKPTDAAELDC